MNTKYKWSSNVVWSLFLAKLTKIAKQYPNEKVTIDELGVFTPKEILTEISGKTTLGIKLFSHFVKLAKTENIK